MSFFKRKKTSQAEFSSTAHKSLVGRIKGYKSYTTPENRQQTDLALRKHLHLELLEVKDLFSKIKNKLMRLQILSTWPRAENISKQLDKLIWLMTAPNSDVYRHSTFFDSPRIDEWIEVNVFYILESEAILQLEEVKNEMKRILERFENGDTGMIEKEIIFLSEKIDELYTSLMDRAELIASMEIMALD